MTDFIIITDPASDTNKQLQEQYSIKVIKGHVILPDGRDIPSPLDWSEYPGTNFYSDLGKCPDKFSTAPPNISEIENYIEPFVKQNKPVLFITMSSAISGTYDFGIKARENLKEKYPNSEIEIFDTRRFGPACSLMAVYASKLRQSDVSFEDTIKWLHKNRNRFHQAGWLDDLSFVAKKGRINHATAFFGTLAGVKPIGEFDKNGMTTVLTKVTGAKNAYQVLLKYIEGTIENPEKQIIFIAQSDRLQQAEIYKKMIEEKFHPIAVCIYDVFPSSGVNVGPGLMAAYYVGKHISDDLSEEKNIIENAIKNK